MERVCVCEGGLADNCVLLSYQGLTRVSTGIHICICILTVRFLLTLRAFTSVGASSGHESSLIFAEYSTLNIIQRRVEKHLR